MSFNPTNQKDFVKVLQYVSENSSSTPANYGVFPTASPVFVAAGINAEISIDPRIVYEEVLALGNYDIADAIKTEETHGFTLKSKIVDSTLAKYGFNVPVGAGTAADSLSFIYSKNIDSVENFTKISGARPLSTTLSLDRGAWMLDQTWIAKDIATENTSHGLTSPTFVSTPTGTPWSHTGITATPLTINSVDYKHRRFSSTSTFDMSILDTNGDVNIIFSKVANRRITMSADVWKKSSVLRADHDAGTPRAAVMSVNSAGSSTLTYVDYRITDWSERHIAGATDALIESISGTAETVVLT